VSHRDEYLVHCFSYSINDLPKIVNDNSEVVLYADDTSLIITSLNPTNFTIVLIKFFKT
jgi:hypothetical protein